MFRYLLVVSFVFLSQYSRAQEPVYDFLVWADEFDGNGAIDGAKWHHQTQLPNGNSWYNGEIQHYTNRTENSYLEDGSLYIKAIKENFTDQGVTKGFSSARLNSKFAFTYGRVEIRAILPEGDGTWPALWTLGKNIIEPGGYWSSTNGTINWPACGEIDIMEHWGHNQDYVSSATHTPSSFGNTVNVDGRIVPNVSNTFHIYEMEWSPEKITFSIDGFVHYTYEPNVQNDATWPFNADQYLLLNFAVLPNITPSFTEDAMQIDYVRIFQEGVLGTNTALLDELITVFPNPVDQLINVNIPSDLLGATLRIYSMLGQELMSEELSNTNSQFDVSSLSRGTYLVQIDTASGVLNEIIVK